MMGTRVLSAEEDMARALLDSLDESQMKTTIINATAPNDIITSAERKVAILEDKGLAYTAMTKSQQGLLLTLINEHATAQNVEISHKRKEAIRAAGLEQIKFAWMGSTTKNEGHYYRVQGSTFLIEYDNTQNNANHVHAVWRDFNGDFGTDMLEAHYHDHEHKS